MKNFLKDIRILDLTSVVVGPICTWRLSQYGANVTKLEAPSGDLMRGLGGQSPTGQHSGAYLHLNRGKRNISLNLKDGAAKPILDKLVEQNDVIVTNMRPQALKKLGLDPDIIRKKYPEKIYCTITGYGSDGTYAGSPAYDSVIQAATGITSLFDVRDGKPSYIPLLICDHVTGEIAAGTVLAAIVNKITTGEGASIEIPMFETMANFVLQEHLAQKSFSPSIGEIGDKRLLDANTSPLKTADGWISVTANTDQQVKTFLECIDREDLIEDARFKTIGDRAKNVKDWLKIRSDALINKNTADWLAIFKSSDISAMPCHTLESLMEDEHLISIGMFDTEQHPTEGQTISLRSSMLFNGVPLPKQQPAQPKGWDTESILKELGFTTEEIDKFVLSSVAIKHIA